jgi:hypothetical protein
MFLKSFQFFHLPIYSIPIPVIAPNVQHRGVTIIAVPIPKRVGAADVYTHHAGKALIPPAIPILNVVTIGFILY